MKINNFRGNLKDTLVKKEALQNTWAVEALSLKMLLFHNENNWYSRWFNRYIRWNKITGECWVLCVLNTKHSRVVLSLVIINKISWYKTKVCVQICLVKPDWSGVREVFGLLWIPACRSAIRSKEQGSVAPKSSDISCFRHNEVRYSETYLYLGHTVIRTYNRSMDINRAFEPA